MPTRDPTPRRSRQAAPEQRAASSNGLVLAAVDRAYRHGSEKGRDAPIWSLLGHLAIAKRTKAAREVRSRLGALEEDGLLSVSRRHGVAVWGLTCAGKRRLEREVRSSCPPDLPESPQHCAWRNARKLAAQERERFRAALETAVDEAVQLAAADPPVPSDRWFELAERLRLVDAMQHAEDLTDEHASAELWVQHSDRLARGDGRAARHAVEIGLWALKRGVAVRCVQDPDTFRDLLYAVVTGQRNHEDSRRRGLAMAAGRRRAAERGDFIGYLPDGYKLAADMDERGHVKKRMMIDPKRREIIATIFRMALRGRPTGKIARALNDAGWRTKPGRRDTQPAKWAVNSVSAIVRNPRYAGLALFGGEIVARGHWPAYITERQHNRLLARIASRAPAKGTKPLRREAYLLAQLMSCGRCGRPLYCQTTSRRVDGSHSRRYICASHDKGRHADRYDAPRIAAAQLEAMVVASLPTLLQDNARPEHVELPEPVHVLDLAWEQQQLRDATQKSERHFHAALGELLARNVQAQAMAEAGLTNRQQRQLAAVSRFEAWAAEQLAGHPEVPRAATDELNKLLKSWFAEVTVDVTQEDVQISVVRRVPADAPRAHREASARFDRLDWTRVACLVNRLRLRSGAWDDVEILGAMQAWAQINDRSPTYMDWVKGNGSWPTSRTVLRHFGKWSRALRRAQLPPHHPETFPRNHPWTDQEVIQALRQWAGEHDQPPSWHDWLKASTERPCTGTVESHFGGWTTGLVAAGLAPATALTARPRARRNRGIPPLAGDPGRTELV
jgi:hypothetical protein